MASDKQKPNSGVIFRAREKKSENHPDGSGSGLIHCPCCDQEFSFWISSWRNVGKSGEVYSKLSFKAKDAPAAKPPENAPATVPQNPAGTKFDDFKDDIPFR